MDSTEKKPEERTIINAGLAGAQAETIQRYGSAVKEHLAAYSGTDHEAGQEFAKGLKDIAKSKINKDYRTQNIRQQAGFSAEVKTAARENADKIIKGQTPARITRTDDMKTQADGKGGLIGGKNEQFYDIAEIDRDGIYIEGTGRQLKFVGGSPEGCYKKLLDKKYDKYREADVPIEVPADYYDGVAAQLDQRSQELKRQIQHAERSGRADLAEQHRKQLEKVENTRKNLRQGSLTSDEAIFARMHPRLSTAADVARVSHSAGLEAAKSGAAIGGGLSFIRNSVAVLKGDKEVGEASLAVVKETAGAAGTSYAVAFAGSALKGAMQNAPTEYVRVLSKTNVPGAAVSLALDSIRTLKKFGTGDITGAECLTELGKKGTGMLASATGAAVGQAVIPIPVVGGLVGGMVGYAMTSAYYNELVAVLNDAKLAHEERLQIEAECKESIAALREYRLEIELAARNYLRESIEAFDSAFQMMGEAYHTGDVDLYIEGANSITRRLGGQPLFESKQEFDLLMASSDPIKL